MLSKLVELTIDAVIVDPQVRKEFNSERIAGFAQTYQEVGQLQPIIVRPDRDQWRLIDGELRLRAAKEAGFKTILAVIEEEELTPGEITHRQLVANQHVDLTPLEKAQAIESLVRESGWSASEVAKKLGMAPGTVSKLLAVLSLPPDIQKRVGTHGLGLTAAYQISLAGNAEAQHRMANDLSSGLLTRDGAEKIRSRKTRTFKRKRSRLDLERIFIPLGGKRSLALSGPSLTLEKIIEWIAQCLERLKDVHSKGIALPEALKLVAAEK